jgi:DNA-binding protein H-NS
MTTLKDLLSQRAALEKQIEEAGRAERSDAIAKVRALMADHGLTAADLSSGKTTARGAVSKGSKVAAKYRNAETGATWSGRGLQPNWLKAAVADGKKLEDFAV